VLYKKPVLVERGTFRPVNNLHVDLLECSRRQFMADSPDNANAVVLMEITMRNLLQNVKVQPIDFLARVDALGAIGTLFSSPATRSSIIWLIIYGVPQIAPSVSLWGCRRCRN